MAERPRFPGTDPGPFGSTTERRSPVPKPQPFNMGNFPGTQRGPFVDAKKTEKGQRVSPVMEDLKGLYAHVVQPKGFTDQLPALVAGWTGTDRVKQMLTFGVHYHANGSLMSALEAISPYFSPEQVPVTHGENTIIAGLYGIIGSRTVYQPKSDEAKVLFDCIVETEDGLTVATMDLKGDKLEFRFRSGFKPGQPRKHAIEYVVIPTCKK